MKTKVYVAIVVYSITHLTFEYSYGLDTDAKTSHTLASQVGGRCHLINISPDDKGKVEQVYTVQDPEITNEAVYEFEGLFANRAQSLLFGVVKGCIMVWDKKSGDVTYGLNHGEGTDLNLGSINAVNLTITHTCL